MKRVFLIDFLVLLPILGIELEMLPPIQISLILLVGLLMAIYSLLSTYLQWKKLFRRPATHRFVLRSLAPVILQLLIAIPIMAGLAYIAYMAIQEQGLFRTTHNVFGWYFYLLVCERGVIYFWHYFTKRHLLVIDKNKISYMGYYLIEIPLAKLSEVVGKWHPELGGDIYFIANTFSSFALNLQYLKSSDEERFKTVLLEIIETYNLKIGEDLQVLRIEAIGKN